MEVGGVFGFESCLSLSLDPISCRIAAEPRDKRGNGGIGDQ